MNDRIGCQRGKRYGKRFWPAMRLISDGTVEKKSISPYLKMQARSNACS
ncbi:MAG: hypothetical protein AB8B79_07505 [Granulosicoccus sp.]